MDMCEVGSYYWTIRHVKMYMKSILVQHTVKGNEQLLFGKKKMDYSACGTLVM